MRFHTHIVFALICGILLYPFFEGNLIIFLLCNLFGTLLPDIDHKQSFLNRKLKITKILPYFTEHRGIFHSLFAGLILFAVCWSFLPRPYAIGVFIGYVAHLFMDSFTKRGVCYLHPLKIFHVKGPFKTGSFGELILFLVFVILLFVVSFR